MRKISKEMSRMPDERIVSKMKCKFLIPFVVAAMAALLSPPLASDASILGSAENFAVLAGTGITNTGSTTITGDVGSDPTGSLTGGPSISLTGAYHLADPVSLAAKNDLTNAYVALSSMTHNGTLGSDLTGVTLTSGVYNFDPGTVLLNGILHLNAEHNNNAFWVFQIPSDLTTGVGSSVLFENLGSNGGNDDGLFWVVGSTASIFGSTTFEGNILALTSITLGTSAKIDCGRALARNGTVTMDTNTINIGCVGTAWEDSNSFSGGLEFDSAGKIVPIGQGSSPVPEPGTMMLLGSGLVGLVGWGRKKLHK